MLQFILGRPGTGKTTFCHSEIADKQQEKAENALILIVPEQFSFSSEKALIAATKTGGLSRARVLSFHRLSYYVFAGTGGMDKKVLEEAGINMLLRKLINQLRNQLVYFKGALEKPGFLDALASSITEFYQYNIQPADVLAKAESADSTNLRLKLVDLHLIYATYKEYLEAEYISTDEVLDILAQKIPQADFLRGAEIWVDGFKSFTPQERNVLRALMSVAKIVKFTFCVTDDEIKFEGLAKYDMFFEAKDSIEHISRLAKELGVTVLTPVFLDKPMRYPNSPDIAYLCQNFPGFSSETYPLGPPNIRLFCAENIFEEIHAAAKIATMLLRDRGCLYSEIGVAASDLALYENYIPAIFSQYDLPVFMDARRDVLSHPLPRLIFAALEVVASNWQYEAVFAMLRSPLVIIPRDEVDLLENYVLAYNIRGRAWREDFKFGPEDESDFLNQIRVKVLDLMAPMADLSPRRAFSIQLLANNVYNFLNHNQIAQTLADWIETAAITGDNEAMRRHEQIWGIAMDTLDKLVEILGSANENIADFAKILEAGFGDQGIAPPSLDQLVVGDLRRSRFGEIRALIVLGVNEGLLMSQPTNSGLLDDSDRVALAEKGLNLAKDSEAKIYEEEFLIYANFSKPSEYLAITYSKGSLDGKAAQPARTLERLKDIFPKIVTTDLEKLPENSLANISAPAATFSEYTRALGQKIIDGKEIAPILLDAADFFYASPFFSAALTRIGQGLEFFVSNQKLSHKNVQKVYGRKIHTSVSRLEHYVNCPFSYFIEYNLAAKPRKLYEVRTMDMGNIYHDILAHFGEFAKSLSHEDFQVRMDAVINEVFENPENKVLKSSGKYTHFARKMRHISEASIAALMKHLARGDFKPIYSEVAFSDLSGQDDGLYLNPVEIPLNGDNSMLLDGRIDRVDIWTDGNNEYVKIIDYKSGRKKFSLSEAYHGLDIQLLVYLSAFIQKLSAARGEKFTTKLLPAAAFYFNLLNPIVNFSQNFQDNPKALEAELLKSFKMSGVVLGQGNIVQALDKGLEAESHILPIGLKKGSTPENPDFRSGGTNVAAEDFDALMNHAMAIAREIGEKILAGQIPVSPAKHKAHAPCSYCGYRSVCNFDSTNRHGYNNLPHLKNEEVLEKIKPLAKGDCGSSSQ